MNEPQHIPSPASTHFYSAPAHPGGVHTLPAPPAKSKLRIFREKLTPGVLSITFFILAPIIQILGFVTGFFLFMLIDQAFSSDSLKIILSFCDLAIHVIVAFLPPLLYILGLACGIIAARSRDLVGIIGLILNSIVLTSYLFEIIGKIFSKLFFLL